MAQYQSIYRKWRPRFFEDMIGQKHISQTLMNAVKLNRITHAYIFSGPRGVGKTTTARILAKALNCQKGPTEHPCNQCHQCIRIDSGQSMDVVEIDGASNRGIDEIRELRSKIGFAPAEGKYKVYIIDEVHMLTNEAFNALLKTLEEPPSQVLFIFATTMPHKVPKTILSRCQWFRFRRIPVDEIVTKLKKIIEEEKMNIDIPSLRLIADRATGSLRDAESILDQVITYSEGQITYEDVKEILGIIPQKFFLRLAESIVVHNTEEGLELINQLVQEGIDLHQFVQDMIIFTHQLSLIKIFGEKSVDSSFLEVDDFKQRLNFVAKTDIKILMNLIEELNQIEEKVKYYHYPWILLELLIVKLTQAKVQPQKENSNVQVVSKQESTEQIKKSDKKRISTDEKELSKNNKYSLTSESIEQQDYQFDDFWPKILSRIKNEKISLYAFLMANSKVRMKGHCLEVGFHQDCLFHKESLEKKENRKLVEEVLKDELKFDIKLRCFVDENKAKTESDFDLAKIQGKIGIEQAEVDELTRQKKQKAEKKKDSSLCATEILEKARDLFGGNISED